MTAATSWGIVLACGIGCFLLKLAGYAVPQRWFESARVRLAIELMPIAVLTALVAVQVFASGRHYDVDGARLAGVGVGLVFIWRKAPFAVVLVSAAATAALLRQI
jgi:uncharacterized membrane protein